jgi:signal peptidase I
MSVVTPVPLRYRAPRLPVIAAAVSAALLASTVGLVGSLWMLTAAGAQVHPVASDSMAPTFVRGDLVVTRPASALRIGEAVTFRKYGHLVTHRIVAQGRVPGTFETRGDANPGNDPWTIGMVDVTGHVQGVVKRAGLPLLVLESGAGRLLGASLLLAAVLTLWWALPRATRIPARVLHPSSGYVFD